jgi:inosine-uridine nucleoside N-ribohydrolase
MLDIYNIITNAANGNKNNNNTSNNEDIANSNENSTKASNSNANNKVYFVVTGAMTNLAVLIKAFPTILDDIQEIVIMGGAINRGNRSPSAEFNILVDP